MGAYFGANFFFRHPQYFDNLIALSGVYSASYFLGDYMNETLYLNSPIDYLKNMNDDYYLNKYKQSKIFICCGQGAYEEEMVYEKKLLKETLQNKEIPAWIDFWGSDVDHDWCWWKKQIQYYLPFCL